MTDSHDNERIARAHRTLDEEIAKEQRRPMPDATHLAQLKRRKLRLKERLEGLVLQ